MTTNPLTQFPPQFAYFRKFLDPQECAAYDRIAAALSRLEPTVRFPELSLESLGRITSALRYDHPELSFATDFRGSVRRSLIGSSMVLQLPALTPQYAQDLALIEAYTRRLQRKKAALGLSGERQTAQWLHDELAVSIRYGGSGHPEAYTLLGAVRGEAVCEGISVLYKYLCSIFGLHCFVVVGELLSGGCAQGTCNHAWNIVHINGQNLFVDVTNDLSPGAARPCEDHFALTRAQLWATHRPCDLRTIPSVSSWQSASVRAL